MAIALVVIALDLPATKLAEGAAAGAGAVLFAWLGQSLRRIGRAPGPERRTHSSARVRLQVPPAAVGLVLLLVGLVPVAVAEVDRLSTILALFPFDGPADPNTRGDRVILRLERLRPLESLGRVGGPGLARRAERHGRDAPGLLAERA